MHPVGQTWISGHKDAAENGASACRACHGTDYRGTVLSQSFADRTLNTDFGTKQFWNGFQIGCYTCHNGPSNESRNPNAAPVVTDLSASTAAGTPAAIALHATDANGNPLVLRVVSQPKNGAAGLLGTVATYYPYDGFSGTDFFTYAANDNQTDSNLGRVTVSVGGGSVCTVTCSASAPASAQAGNSVSFTGSATASACADPLTYDWNFGDGSAHAFTASASHTYASPGTYTWSFTAAAGAISCSKSGTITVGATSCTLTCSASVPSTGKVGQELSFSGSASSNCQGEIRYQWQFGDGTGPSGDRTTTHKYNAPGAYTWQFTATRNADSCSKSGTITVSSTATPPVISQITQLSNPFRLRISGSNFQSGAKVYIGSDSAPWSNTTRQSSTSLTLSGSGLRNRFPKGVTVAIRGVNPDGGSATDSLVRGGDG
jgi:PKD repeat protein